MGVPNDQEAIEVSLSEVEKDRLAWVKLPFFGTTMRFPLVDPIPLTVMLGFEHGSVVNVRVVPSVGPDEFDDLARKEYPVPQFRFEIAPEIFVSTPLPPDPPGAPVALTDEASEGVIP